MKRYIILLFFLNCMLVSAQESQYEIMKMLLNENSLPLVNMTVDYKTINRFDYVPGEIEITDYLCRTDSSTSTVKFHCKYRIRGVSSTYYKKNLLLSNYTMNLIKTWMPMSLASEKRIVGFLMHCPVIVLG